MPTRFAWRTSVASRVRPTCSSRNPSDTATEKFDCPGAAEAQAHVFERFYRLEGGRASGSGLGLAIARELAALMNGRIELVSAPGATRFTLVLPVDVSERPHELLEPLVSR